MAARSAGAGWRFHHFWVLCGVGLAMVCPTLLGAIDGVSHYALRASAVGIYRLWRVLAYTIGALRAGITVALFDLPFALWLVARLMREMLGKQCVACDFVPSAPGTHNH